MDPTPQEAAALADKKKKKGQKMSLGEFNANAAASAPAPANAPAGRQFSWADEMDTVKPTLPTGPSSAASAGPGAGQPSRGTPDQREMDGDDGGERGTERRRGDGDEDEDEEKEEETLRAMKAP